jgi:hypothetical protein
MAQPLVKVKGDGRDKARKKFAAFFKMAAVCAGKPTKGGGG